jgi:hypothetical protein
MTGILAHADLALLTGRSYAPAQKRVLDRRGIKYTEDGDGRPVVLWATVERLHLGKPVTPAPSPVPAPDFSAFPKLA